jgi:hypothetical protein
VRPIITDALIIVLLPFVVFIAGARLMSAWTGRAHVTTRLQQHAAAADRTPLNQRLRYDAAAVARHWGALDRDTLAAERQFLELDLVSTWPAPRRPSSWSRSGAQRLRASAWPRRR